MRRREYDWEAAASYRIGVFRQESGDFWRARLAYADVLDRVPDHVPALHNAAVVELRGENFGLALEHLGRLADLVGLDDLMADGSSWPLIAYSALYNRALARFYVFGRDGFPSPGVVNDSARLVRQILQRVDQVPAPGRQGPSPEQPALERLEPVAVIFHAGLLVRTGAQPPALYDGQPREPPPTRAMVLAALDHRETWPDTAFAYVEHTPFRRARYNLACFFARLHMAEYDERYLAQALGHLTFALQDPELLAWAKHDPVLEDVRRMDGWRELLKRVEPPPARSGEKEDGGEPPAMTRTS